MLEEETTLQPRKSTAKTAAKPVPTLTIMSHPNPGFMGRRVFLTDLQRGKPTALSRLEPLFRPPGAALGEPLADRCISRQPLWLKPGGDSALLLDPGATPTTLQVDVAAEDGVYAVPLTRLSQGFPIILADRILLLLHWAVPNDPPSSTRDHGLVGDSAVMVQLRREIERVADLKTPVLLRGASGTGKELVARAIHQHAGGKGPLICVNLGAIPQNLAASELFGAVKGAFTGAVRDQQGYFRAAQGGTLFLDEVGEASAEVQVMLLRALETGDIHPVGAPRSIAVNTRVIAATDADLEKHMADQSFKTPLFHRLAGYQIRVPRLADRLEDLPRLFLHFARRELAATGESRRLEPANRDQAPWLPPTLAAQLINEPWPGNVRQLRNVVRRLVIAHRGQPQLQFEAGVAALLSGASQANAAQHDAGTPPRRKPGSVDTDALKAALRACDGNIKAAAQHLGMARTSVYELIKKTPGLRTAADLDAAELAAAMDANNGDIAAVAHHFCISQKALRLRLTRDKTEP